MATLLKLTVVARCCALALTCLSCNPVPLFIAILPLIRHYTGKWGIVDEKFCEILDPEDLDEDEHEDGA